jgi:uncharacterized membrane protein YcaP (DUF421 family)
MISGAMFFNNWAVLGRTVVVGVLAYLALVLVIRIAGKRTLSKMNAFDLIVTVALGSTLASILLSPEVSLAEGGVAFVVLAGMQFVISWSSLHLHGLRRLVTAQPQLLFQDGRMRKNAMRRARVTEAEVLAAMRQAGHRDTAGVMAVVMETDGSLSVLDTRGQGASTLQGVDERD